MKRNQNAVTGIIQWIGYIGDSEKAFCDFLETEKMIDKNIFLLGMNVVNATVGEQTAEINEWVSIPLPRF